MYLDLLQLKFLVIIEYQSVASYIYSISYNI